MAWIGENLSPFAERLICRDQQRTALVARADQLEEDAGLGLILGDIGEIVEDQQVIFVELVDGRFEREIAPGDLQLLNEVGGAGEEHAPSLLDEREAEGCRQVATSPPPGGPNSSKLAPFSSQASPAASACPAPWRPSARRRSRRRRGSCRAAGGPRRDGGRSGAGFCRQAPARRARRGSVQRASPPCRRSPRARSRRA